MNIRKSDRLKASVYIDVNNQPDLDLGDLLQRLECYEIVEKQAFADYRNTRLKPQTRELGKRGFKVHHVPGGNSPGAMKNTAGEYVNRGAVKSPNQRHDVSVAVIVSGDASFCPLVRQLHREGKYVIVAAQPRRMSKKLMYEADEYLATGELARTLEELDRLERANRYVTFSFAADQLNICTRDLSWLIEREYLLQDCITKPQRGTRPEIWLNRQSRVVQRVMHTAA
ncbi:MAG: NYN domain-containing protein [Anaerolineae bacterium]|nr:NYN domain-containing protein [Anaerolineae bacterium]